MKKLIVFGFFLMVGCSAIIPPQPPTTPCDACGLYKDPVTVGLCRAVYCQSTRPTPTATQSAVPTATAVPRPTGTPKPIATPFPTMQPTVPSTCAQAPTVYNNKVRQAISSYQMQHPAQFDPGNPNFLLYKDLVTGETITQDQFIWGVCNILGGYGYDCIEDPCMCGDMAVALSSDKIGTSFAEQYHPISSQRLVQMAPYLERCTPRWF